MFCNDWCLYNKFIKFWSINIKIKEKTNEHNFYLWSMWRRTNQFFVKEGDYSHLNGVYINGSEEKLMDELNDILFVDVETSGDYKVKFLKKFPVNKVTKDTKVIVVGFLP